MSVFHQIVSALPVVAASWQAVVGYVSLVIAFVVVSVKVTRNKNLLAKLKSLPERDRARVLEMDMGAAYLATGLSPEQWLQRQRQQYYFFSFVAVCGLVLALVVAARVSASPNPRLIEEQKRTAAGDVARRVVAAMHTRSYEAVYDMLPEQVKRNLPFAQARVEAIRTMFQVPPKPLKHTIEQVVENGGYLTTLVSTEFSVDTRIRDVVTFTRSDTDWALLAYNWQPVEWPLHWPASTEVRTSAAASIDAYRTLTQEERSVPLPLRFRGSITGSTPGWRLTVESILQRSQDGYRCDVRAVEQSGTYRAVKVHLKDVIGGCELKAGMAIVVHAMFSGVSDQQVELVAVKYLPVNMN